MGGSMGHHHVSPFAQHGNGNQSEVYFQSNGFSLCRRDYKCRALCHAALIREPGGYALAPQDRANDMPHTMVFGQ